MAKYKISNLEKTSNDNTKTSNYAGKIINSNDINSIFKEIASGITAVSVFFLFTIFPLYTHDYYFDILSARYVFFKLIVIIMMILFVALIVLYFLIDNDKSLFNAKGGAFSRLIDSLKPENFSKYFIITDIFFVIMLITVAISTLLSQYHEESFFGNSGRYQGFECWILYFMLYVMISRTFKFKRIYLDFMIFAGALACLWGITDFFNMDLFHFFVNVQSGQRQMFMSSIGNLDTYTNYTLMVFGISGALFLIEDNPYKSIYYGVIAFVSSIGSVFGLADNTILGFAAFFLVSPFLAIHNNRSLVRYFYLAAMFFLSINCIYYITLFTSNFNDMESFFKELAAIKAFRFLSLVFLICAIALEVAFRKQGIANIFDLPSPKYIQKVWVAVLLSLMLILVLFLIDVNVTHYYIDTWRKTIPSLNQFTFNDDWGTHRGHNWRIAFTNFLEFDWLKRLFGFGPDTYLIVSERSHYEEMVQRYNEVYDSAHNEYINYLICEGLIGLSCYLGIFISGLKSMAKIIKSNKAICAIMLAILAYMVQAIVNIAIPITTPIFFTLLYCGVACYIDSVKEIKSNKQYEAV